MSTKIAARRHADGSSLDGRALTKRVAHEVKGMPLAQAFVTARAAGYQLLIAKHDGVPRDAEVDRCDDRIVVNVVQGLVADSWVG
jgi:hypothetical protein